MADQGFTPDQQNLLERAWLVQQRSREVHPGTNRDLKVIEECAEFGEAAMRLTHALSRRLSGYANGGARGKVDEELADAFFAAMKLLTPDSAAWGYLAQKVERFEALLNPALPAASFEEPPELQAARAAARAKGLCGECMKRPAKPGNITMCQECLDTVDFPGPEWREALRGEVEDLRAARARLSPDEFRTAVCEAMGLTGDESDRAVIYQAVNLRHCGEVVAAQGTIVHCVDCADTGMFGEERCHCRGQEASHA